MRGGRSEAVDVLADLGVGPVLPRSVALGAHGSAVAVLLRRKAGQLRGCRRRRRPCHLTRSPPCQPDDPTCLDQSESTMSKTSSTPRRHAVGERPASTGLSPDRLRTIPGLLPATRTELIVRRRRAVRSRSRIDLRLVSHPDPLCKARAKASVVCETSRPGPGVGEDGWSG